MDSSLFCTLTQKKVVRRDCCLANIASFESANLADVWKLSMYIPWDRPTIVSQKKYCAYKSRHQFLLLMKNSKAATSLPSFIWGGSPLQSKSFNWWASYKNQRKWSIISSLLLSDLDSLFSLPYISLLFLSSFFFSTSPDLLLLTPLTPFQSVRLLVCLPSLFSISALSQPSFFSSSLSVSKYLILTHNLHAWYLRSFGD